MSPGGIPLSEWSYMGHCRANSRHDCRCRAADLYLVEAAIVDAAGLGAIDCAIAGEVVVAILEVGCHTMTPNKLLERTRD
jgi:hypothetical protein